MRSCAVAKCALITETARTRPITERPEIYNLYAAHTVLNRWSRPDEIATAVAYLASDRPDAIGQRGGLSK